MNLAPATMARRSAADGVLPEEIIVWEILVRLPVKTLLRCRAVCRSWRRLTSSRVFLLAHHSNQRRLPLFSGSGAKHDPFGPPGFFLYDPRAPAAAASEQIQSFPQLDVVTGHPTYVHASCDGLLVTSFAHIFHYIYNPATSQLCYLNQLEGFGFLGLYPHRPTAGDGEYRLLLYRRLPFDDPRDEPTCFVLTLGNSRNQQEPRCIGWPTAGGVSIFLISLCERLLFSSSILVRGSLHLYPPPWQQISDDGSGKIMVFDTLAESIRFMAAPIVSPDVADLFEMDGTLGMYNWNHDERIVRVDLWVMEDYDLEVWKFMCRVELPVAEIIGKFELDGFGNPYVVVVAEGTDIHVLINTNGGLLHFDTKGRLLANYHHDERRLSAARHMVKPSLVPHTFF